MVSCPRCGSDSVDPDFCDVCGADLSAGAASLRLVHGDRLVFELLDPRNNRTELVAITLAERTGEFTARRVWMAQDQLQRYYRVEELDGVEDDEPDAIPVFPDRVDVPVAITTYNERAVRIYRQIEGQLLAQRLQQLNRTLTPAEIVAWMEPILEAVHLFHQAGFVSLKLCPYTILYRTDGAVFLQNTDGLYRCDMIPTSLPAITGYTAPEIYSSDFSRPPGPAADMFSLAMVAYFLVTRRDPPVSMYSSFLPAIPPRDIALEFPLGFAPFFSVAAAADPDARPGSIAEFRCLLLDSQTRAEARTQVDESIRFSVASETHTGIFKRVHHPINQDHVFSACCPDHQLALIAVADGVSTASFGSGDLASALAGRRIHEAWNELLAHPGDLEQQGPAQWLTALMHSINDDIVAWINERFTPFTGEPSEVMGTTCVLLLAWRGIATLASLGDSRAYLIRSNYIELITRDHNLMTLGIVDGLDADFALMMPQGDALARCLGLFDTLPDQSLCPQRLHPDIYQFALRQGDRVLLCSDGLTDFAGATQASSELAILRAVQREPQPEVALLDLVHLANKGGGGDNIGVAMLAAETTPPSLVRWLQTRRSGQPSLADSDDAT
jgi:serine/threonine protein phosphatase PrpC